MKNTTVIHKPGGARCPYRAVSLFALFALFVVTLSPRAEAALTITSGTATNVTRTNAWIEGTLSATNGTNATVILFYGTTDASTNAASWATSNYYGNIGTQAFSTNITGLTPAQLYYFRWYAIEGAATDWSDASSNLWTLAGVPTGTPAVPSYHPVMVDTNGLLVAPTNFWIANTGGLSLAGLVFSSDWIASNLYFQAQISSNDTDISNLFTSNAAQEVLLDNFFTSNWAQQVSIDGLFTSNTAQQVSIDGLFTSNWTQQVSIDGLFTSNTAQEASIDSLSTSNAAQQVEITTLQTGKLAVTDSDWLYIIAQSNSWNLAHDWGDHALAGYWLADGSLPVTGPIEWSAGNVTWVPLASNIQDYVDAATAGDTLKLAAGTYTRTTALTINKALTIIGQGTTIDTVTDSINLIHITADNVSLQNLSVDVLASNSKCVYADGTGGDVLSNVDLDNVTATLNSHAGLQSSVQYDDAGGHIRNCEISAASTTTLAVGLYYRIRTTAEAETTLYCSDTRISASSGSLAVYAVYVDDDGSSYDASCYLSRCTVTATESGACDSSGMKSSGSDAFLYADNCVVSATDYDVYQGLSATLQLRSSILVNNTTSGTITRDGTLHTDGLALGTGATVDNIETTITDDDTHIPSSGAIVDYVAGYVKADGSVARTADQNYGGFGPTNMSKAQFQTSVTNSLTMEWYALSNRWAWLEIYGTAPSVTNVYFWTLER